MVYKLELLEVIFKPNVEGNIERNLFIACDSKINLPWSIKGEGIMVDMQLVSLDGLNLDETPIICGGKHLGPSYSECYTYNDSSYNNNRIKSSVK